MTKLEIVLNDNGSVTITGPIENKILCWGLLQAATLQVFNYDPSAKKMVVPIASFAHGRAIPKNGE